ncbi:hypothetical protein KFV02_04870 [Desulfohalobiaceae bacterium Ax17]|uniref:type III-A CRISPR-associated RAMP protein Csm4 n=1 Tax=Desulfovulcanus ferrireducens TaxID=2831190 RepID=UPI00207BAAE6|nr:RAMP superfamily CRISPR-associated protein [Desulfovulcanus ferrireducens]MBT8763261.1 hypothetical protein [Desulfovulcanus ferrireducens]
MYVRYKITLLSRLITPLYSDTIFGHLCWGLRYLKGEKFLQSFLDAFDDVLLEDAPMLISCAFPHNYLPLPVLPALERSLLRKLALKIAAANEKLGDKSEDEKLFWGSQVLKKIRKQKWIAIDDWLRLRENATQENMICMAAEKLNQKTFRGNNQESVWKSIVRAHNTISRKTGTVLEPGGLYFVRESWANPGSCFDVYVKFASQEYQNLWDEVWQEYIVPTGFGKDKSTGAGQLVIEQDNEFNPGCLFDLKEYNAWMSLSLLGFERMPDLPCYYSVFSRFGKLGGSFAVHSPDGSKPNPFKKPMILLEPGAVFKDNTAPAGALLQDVHVDARIRHYAMGLWLPLRIVGGGI